MAEVKSAPWYEIVEFVREHDNGVCNVSLQFTNGGDNACEFKGHDDQRGDVVLGRGFSRQSMQTAVDLCYYDFWSTKMRMSLTLMREQIEAGKGAVKSPLIAAT